MGIQMMGSHQSNGQQSHLQPCQLLQQSSWYSLSLNEVEKQLGNLGKPLDSMNLDELLQNVWCTEDNQDVGMDERSNLSSSLQRQASLTLARAWSGKTVDQVWKEIQQVQKKRFGEEVKPQGGEPKLGETTLEDFLVQAGLYAEPSWDPAVGLVTADSETEKCLSQKMVSSPSSSIGTLLNTKPSGRKRDAPEAPEKSIEKRLRRMIKNRESAARSRARKQAYHNELVTKVSRLEEENMKLKKHEDFDNMFPCQPSSEQRYQLRRTSSATF